MDERSFKAMLTGAIVNGIRRYTTMVQLDRNRLSDYVNAIRKAYVVSTALGLQSKQIARVYVYRELYNARLPVWWNYIKGKEVEIDYDKVQDIKDLAEIVFLSRKDDENLSILNTGEAEAELILYLEAFLDDEELWRDPEAVKNFAEIFPYAYYSEILDEEDAYVLKEKAISVVNSGIDVPDWVRFVITRDEKYLRGKYSQLQDYRYWFVLF